MTELYKHAEAVERLGGDEELFATVVSLFVAESEGYCSALEAALAAARAGCATLPIVGRRRVDTGRVDTYTGMLPSAQGLSTSAL